jgi:alpha-glucosidase
MDVGGFTGVPTQSLFARWMQIGAFTPYFRNHAASDTKASEPWTYGDDVLDISRNYVNLRYRLMPYLYSAFADAAAGGEPVMRSLAIDYTHDPKIYEPAFQNQYMFGRAFLVAPFESTRDFGKVYFPAGSWYDLATDGVEQGGRDKIIELNVATLPVYVRAGSVVPVQSLVQSTAEKPTDTLALHVYKGDAASTSSYYEDDGATFAYQQGAYYRRAISYDGAARRITIGAAEGSLKSKFARLELVLHGFGDAPSLQVNGKPLPLASARYAFIGAASADQVKVSTATIGNDSGELVISY